MDLDELSPPSTHTGRLLMGTLKVGAIPKTRRILAIDPSTTSLGWAIGEHTPGLKDGKVVELGTLRPDAGQAAPERIVALVGQLSRLWQDKGPFEVVVTERASGFRGPQGYKIPAELTALMARLKRWALDEVKVGEFIEYHPSTVRAAVVTKETTGKVVKARIKAGVLAKHPQLARVKASQDAIDAVAVLDCFWEKLHQGGA